MDAKHIQVPDDENMVSCEVCMKTIPTSEADSAEAEDYVAYFCGLECYDEWAKQKANEETEKTES